jgi:hypothetical protein
MWLLRLMLMFVFYLIYYYTQAIGVLAFPTVLLAFQYFWYHSDKNIGMIDNNIKRETELNIPIELVDEIY